jgi:hypothetical protein
MATNERIWRNEHWCAELATLMKDLNRILLYETDIKETYLQGGRQVAYLIELLHEEAHRITPQRNTLQRNTFQEAHGLHSLKKHKAVSFETFGCDCISVFLEKVGSYESYDFSSPKLVKVYNPSEEINAIEWLDQGGLKELEGRCTLMVKSGT